MFARIPVLSLAVLLASSANAAAAADWKAVEPVLAAKCYSCHGAEKTKGDVNLQVLAQSPDVPGQHELWKKVMDTIEAGEMPPKKAKALEGAEKQSITIWVKAALDELARANSGDPGPVTMRRLTNAEYDHTVRDLTGRDYGLAREFQTDGGGGEGFSNTGDVLFMSAAALDKYFAAARKLADHATVLPGTGIAFHSQRIGLRSLDQVRAQAQQGLYVWYQQKAAPHLPKDMEPMREADYMLACWRHKKGKTPLEQLAKEMGLSIHFLQNWWRLVNATEPKSRFLDLLRVGWRELPGEEKAALEKIKALEAELLSWNNPKKPGNGVQRQQQDSDGIRPYSVQMAVSGKSVAYLCVGDLGDGNKGDVAQLISMEVSVGKQKLNYLNWLDKTLQELRGKLAMTPLPADAEALRGRAAELEKMRALYGKHPQAGRQVGPQALVLAAPTVLSIPLPQGAHWLRATLQLDMQNAEVDAATMQWTLSVDRPRDVAKIMPGVLTIWKRGTKAAQDTMRDFSVMKAAFPDMYERRLEEVADNLHRWKPGIGVYYFSDEQLGALLGEEDRYRLSSMKKDWGYTAPSNLNEQQKKEYDGAMMWHLHDFARKAWRRPLAEEEKKVLGDLYFSSRQKELDRESAAREVMVRVLVSPHFLFKAETLPVAQQGEVALSAHELASRLSYFLWASMPDWQLRKAADTGELLKPEVLRAQVQRMLKDARARALAEQFAAQWLKFSGFEGHDSVDLKKYPEFTPELRAAMQREVVEFFSQMFRQDRNVSDIILGDYSYLNETLARHYGVPGVAGAEFREVKVAAQQRGGVLGMGAVLTKTARPHRTSPVLRGDYLYGVVLGFHSPPPPPNVPELPAGADKPASLREALMRHRADQACSVCHDRIDPLGFMLEGFDPIGRYRQKDESGTVVDDTGVLKTGSFKGLPGLRTYLKQNEDMFLLQFSRKLLGYALGRQTLPTDQALLNQMREALKKSGGRPSEAVLQVVLSRQFLKRRAEVVAGL